jgi:hypothetical protein
MELIFSNLDMSFSSSDKELVEEIELHNQITLKAIIIYINT